MELHLPDAVAILERTPRTFHGLLSGLTPAWSEHFGGTVFERVWSLSALVGIGAGVFFAVAYLVGALDKDSSSGYRCAVEGHPGRKRRA